jgi:hypothetical protein
LEKIVSAPLGHPGGQACLLSERLVCKSTQSHGKQACYGKRNFHFPGWFNLELQKAPPVA